VLAWSVSVRAGGPYSGVSTGYAFAHLTGAAGVEMYQGYYAHHNKNECPGDPSAYWSYGTWITGVSPNVAMYDSNGYTIVWTAFALEDWGDPYPCPRGDYWADWYFGRWKPSSDTCSCNNGGGEVCYLGSHNNCTDANNWGTPSASYYH
jgi:hypothetical protein